MRTLRSLVLASSSPRRRAILRALGVRCRVVAPCVDESSAHRGRPDALVRRNALVKARAVAAAVSSGLVLGADTIVWCDGRVLGKPNAWAQVRVQWRRLNGRTHWVYTGLALVDASGRSATAVERTRVRFRRVSPACLRRYWRRIRPLDKAGAYAIQRQGELIIDRVDGCLSTVVGLSVPLLERLLRRWRYRLP